LIKKNDQVLELEPSSIYYDLASVSKVLTNGIAYLDDPNKTTDEMWLLLNHRAGLPPYGELNKSSWREDLQSYAIKESPTVYSDFSAIRYMLEYEKNNKVLLKDIVSSYWADGIYHWKDLPKDVMVVPNGMRHQEVIAGEVHDPRAYHLDEFVTHAGLFGPIAGVCQTLINLEERTGFLKKIKSLIQEDNKTQRFYGGWDRAEDPVNTLAGSGCGEFTFGHLGFTGTSIWIDPDTRKGHVILTNATKNFWYNKTELNTVRRQIGSLIWGQ
jgi:hypothetical protein